MGDDLSQRLMLLATDPRAQATLASTLTPVCGGRQRGMLVTLAAGFVLGCFLGSFLNVCAHRLPRGESVVAPGSRCYACGTPVQWYDNLPVLSYLVLGGRCRWCGSRFSSRYLWVEVVTGLLTAVAVALVLHRPWGLFADLPLMHDAGWQWLLGIPAPAPWLPLLGQALAAAAVLLVLWYLLVCSLVDYDHLIIPDELSMGLQPLAPFLALALTPMGMGAAAFYHRWPMAAWMITRRFDGVPLWQLDTAALRLLLVSGSVAAVLLTTLPVARLIYGRRVIAEQRWSESDHRAFRRGLWWFLLALLPALVVAMAIAWSAGPRPAGWQIYGVLALGQAILGSLCAWSLPYLVGLGGTLVFGRNAMGYGDVKFLAPLGAVLGPIGVVVAFLLAACLGVVVGVPLRLLGRGQEIPFGPYLAAAALIALLAGERLLSAVLAGVVVA